MGRVPCLRRLLRGGSSAIQDLEDCQARLWPTWRGCRHICILKRKSKESLSDQPSVAKTSAFLHPYSIYAYAARVSPSGDGPRARPLRFSLARLKSSLSAGAAPGVLILFCGSHRSLYIASGLLEFLDSLRIELIKRGFIVTFRNVSIVRLRQENLLDALAFF